MYVYEIYLDFPTPLSPIISIFNVVRTSGSSILLNYDVDQKFWWITDHFNCKLRKLVAKVKLVDDKEPKYTRFTTSSKLVEFKTH